jgi:hypothetical protein
MKRYYYADGSNNPIGPLAAEELLELHRVGGIRSTTLVTEEGSENWLPLYEHNLSLSTIKSEIIDPKFTTQTTTESNPPPLTAGKGAEGAKLISHLNNEPKHSDAPPAVANSALKEFYTEEDAKKVAVEVSDYPGWSVFLNVIGTFCMVGVLISLLAAIENGLSIPLIVGLIVSGLSCFFWAHLVTRLRDMQVYQRELYMIEKKRELRNNKHEKNGA